MKLVLAFNLSRVYEHYKRKRFCIVSAYLMKSPLEVNQARAKALKQEVRSRGYGYVEMEGHWIETSGEHKGKELKEWPLFIPNCTYEDAVYFGSGQYYPPAPEPQQSVIFADGEKILMLSSTPGGQWNVDFSMENLQTNLESSLKRWYQRRQQLAGEIPTPEGEGKDDEYMGWSVLNPKHKPTPWRFSVTLAMPEPPEPGSAESWGDSIRRATWKNDRACHEFYQPPASAHRPYRRPPKAGASKPGGDSLLYRGALYVKTASPRVKLPKQVVALLRRRFRVPNFSSEISIPEKNAAMWDINPNDILESTLKYREEDRPVRFSWHPVSGEFLLSTPSEMHAHTIRSHGTHPFDEYVRGIVLRDQGTIATRPWAPNVDFGMMTGDPEEDRAQQYMMEQASKESQEACRHTLTTVGGVPASWKWRFDVSNADLQDMTGIFRW
jgi:hypothetical protein